MIARAGASVALSTLIVAVAAVALRDPKRPPTSAVPAPRASEPRPAPSVTPGVAWTPPPAPDAMPSPAPSRAAITPKVPEGSFTRANARETLADFAARVYGDAAFRDAVWRRNREQVPDPAATLRGGMILRTPELRPADATRGAGPVPAGGPPG